MIEIVTVQKIKTDNKFNNACDIIIQDCQNIQQSGQDEKLIALATEIIEKIDELEKFYVN